MQVKLGGSVQSVTSVRQCQARLDGFSVDEVQMCLQAEASASAKVSQASSEIKHCKKDVEKTESKSSFSDRFNDRCKTPLFLPFLLRLLQHPFSSSFFSSFHSFHLPSLHSLLPPPLSSTFSMHLTSSFFILLLHSISSPLCSLTSLSLFLLPLFLFFSIVCRFTDIKGGHNTDPDLLFSANKNPSAYQNWLTSLPQHPDLISYSLESLHQLLPDRSPVQRHLQAAISHYILERGLWRNCSERCRAGVHSQGRDPCVCQCHNQVAVGSDCCPTRKGLARVVLRVQRATGLWGDHTTATDGYVKVSFNNIRVGRTQVINNNNNPYWSMEVDLGTQDLTQGSQVRFEVWDQDNDWDDDLLGTCSRTLAAGSGQDVCNMQHGRLFFSWQVTCAPSLVGNTCSTYKPSPISRSLAPHYVSRHATRIPYWELQRMGVFVEEAAASGKNHSQSQTGEEKGVPQCSL